MQQIIVFFVTYMCLLIEQASGRQSNLLTAEVVRGMCPDMCPEKERYMREDRRRLSVYEMVPGTDLVCGSQCLQGSDILQVAY